MGLHITYNNDDGMVYEMCMRISLKYIALQTANTDEKLHGERDSVSVNISGDWQVSSRRRMGVAGQDTKVHKNSHTNCIVVRNRVYQSASACSRCNRHIYDIYLNE